MNKPNGKDLLELLVKLLAEQEGVKLTYEIRKGDEDEKA
jgi:hypothetical protein